MLQSLVRETVAEIAAILLAAPAGPEFPDPTALRLSAWHSRDDLSYRRVSDNLSRAVLSSREAILARDVSDHTQLAVFDSLGEIRARSVVCTPIHLGERVLGLIHLYATNPDNALDKQDLEFTLAIAGQLAFALDSQLERESLKSKVDQVRTVNRSLRKQLETDQQLIGESQAMCELRNRIGLIAETDASVLIRGESGCGKELIARMIHSSSPRRECSFVCLNCAALNESLLESELFGHEAGAFTGANKRRIGKFEHADGGTLFLDEIETMPQFLQIKILRSLQEKVIERLGSNNLHKVDLQVIAASKVELRDNPDFRQDLFYRLNISELQIPALRERVEDIPLLFDRYLKLAVQQQAGNMRQLSADELRALMSYQWPGNVRELKNVALRYAVDTENSLMELLRPTSLSTAIGSEGDEQLGSCEVSPLAVKVASFEEQVIRMSLDKHCGNIKQTLLELDLPRRTLNQKMIRYGINRADYRND